MTPDTPFATASQPGCSTTTVERTIALTREWLTLHGSAIPGFRGAYLVGSILRMPTGAPFPAASDVDLHILLQSGSRPMDENLEVCYKGVPIECGFWDFEAHCDASAMLADPRFAPNLAITQILADPTGKLEQLRQVVVREFARKEWVAARCRWEQREALTWLDAMDEGSQDQQLFCLWFGLNALAGMLAMTRLQVPTHRRTLAQLRELLGEQGRLDLHEEALAVFGSATFRQAETEQFLEAMAAAYDRAVEVWRSPSPFGFKMRAHIRPYAVEGSREMIEDGNHREALFWLWIAHCAANIAIQNDAPAQEKPVFQAAYDRLVERLGLHTPEVREHRAQEARRLAEHLFQLANRLLEEYREPAREL